MARVGGLGAVLGDQGSGYDLGRQGLRAAGLALEGRGPATRLTELLLHWLQLAALGDLVRWSTTATTPVVAALAPVVLDAAAAADAVAGGIADACADDLARHVRALADRFPRGAAVRVALGGSLLARSADYRKRVVARIMAEVMAAEIADAPVDAVLGAIQMARTV